MSLPFNILCTRPLLIVAFAEPQRFMSWSLTHPGFSTVKQIVWLEVRNRDLSEHIDAQAYLRRRLSEAGYPHALGLLTSRDIRAHHLARSVIGQVSAVCLTTVGLSNAERVGMRIGQAEYMPGTINTVVHVSVPLSEAAYLETLSIAAQARTTAILDQRVQRAGVAITGTGTDCLAIGAPAGRERINFAGLHTAVGEAVGACVYAATTAGTNQWLDERAKA